MTLAALSPPRADAPALTAESLRELARAQGYDAALRAIHDAVRTLHAGFIDQVDAITPEQIRALSSRNFTLAIVPGALYREYPQTGADGQRFIDIIHRLGLRTATIPIKSLGSLAENAAIITQWLAARPGQSFILVSFSKGSADIKYALLDTRNHPAFRNVSAWLSVGGILHGTPLVAWLQSQPIRYAFIRFYLRLRGFNPKPLEQLAHSPPTPSHALRTTDHLLPLAAPTIVPPWMRLIHLITFPTASDLSIPLAHRAFRRLLPLGPNDAGGLLLADLLHFPGSIYPLRHADHYLRTCSHLPQLLAQLLTAAV